MNTATIHPTDIGFTGGTARPSSPVSSAAGRERQQNDQRRTVNPAPSLSVAAPENGLQYVAAERRPRLRRSTLQAASTAVSSLSASSARNRHHGPMASISPISVQGSTLVADAPDSQSAPDTTADQPTASPEEHHARFNATQGPTDGDPCHPSISAVSFLPTIHEIGIDHLNAGASTSSSPNNPPRVGLGLPCKATKGVQKDTCEIENQDVLLSNALLPTAAPQPQLLPELQESPNRARSTSSNRHPEDIIVTTDSTSSGTSAAETSQSSVPSGSDRQEQQQALSLRDSQLQTREVSPTESDADQGSPEVEEASPDSGPTTGGRRIVIIGRNFPLVRLYVRFGDSITCATPRSQETLPCILPPASYPGIVKVTFSEAPSNNAPEYGRSFAHFTYEDSRTRTLLSQVETLLSRVDGSQRENIQTSLQKFLATASQLGTDTSANITPERETDLIAHLDSPVNRLENLSIRVLSAYSRASNWKQTVSLQNEYGQTLAHMSVMLGYLRLLAYLVDWGIDLNLTDLKGSTALHYAFLFNEATCAVSLIRSGADELALDELGRSPWNLNPSLVDEVISGLRGVPKVDGSFSVSSHLVEEEWEMEPSEDAAVLRAKRLPVLRWLQRLEEGPNSTKYLRGDHLPRPGTSVHDMHDPFADVVGTGIALITELIKAIDFIIVTCTENTPTAAPWLSVLSELRMELVHGQDQLDLVKNEIEPIRMKQGPGSNAANHKRKEVAFDEILLELADQLKKSENQFRSATNEFNQNGLFDWSLLGAFDTRAHEAIALIQLHVQELKTIRRRVHSARQGITDAFLAHCFYHPGDQSPTPEPFCRKVDADVSAGFQTHSLMPSLAKGFLQETCMKCGQTDAQFPRRLKRCAGCDGTYYCVRSKNCQMADWKSHRRVCKPSPLGVRGKALRAHISSWFRVYKALLEWTVHQASLGQTGDYDANSLHLVMELDYSEGAFGRNVPCLYSTRLSIHPAPVEGQSSLPDPFNEEGAKIIQCTLRGCAIIHKYATFDGLKSNRPCSRWNYVVADMVTLGFQMEEQIKESLPLVITRHNMFEAFVGGDSPLKGEPFPHLSRPLPAELGVAPWIWIEDPCFIAWFTKVTGKTIAARVAELEAQASQDKCLEMLLQWATNPELSTLEDRGSHEAASLSYEHGTSNGQTSSSGHYIIATENPFADPSPQGSSGDSRHSTASQASATSAITQPDAVHAHVIQHRGTSARTVVTVPPTMPLRPETGHLSSSQSIVSSEPDSDAARCISLDESELFYRPLPTYHERDKQFPTHRERDERPSDETTVADETRPPISAKAKRILGIHT